MGHNDRCCVGDCQESAFIYYKGRGICLRHWKEYRGVPSELKKMLRLPYPPTMTEEEKEFSARLQCHRASTHSVSYLFCRIFETMDEDD